MRCNNNCYVPSNMLFSNVYIREVIKEEIISVSDTLKGDSAYEVAVKLGYKGNEEEWLSEQGATIEQINVNTGEAGTEASVILNGTPKNRIIDLTIPKGDKGIQGEKGDTGEKGDKGLNGRDGSYVQKAYKTYAGMIADKDSIPIDTSVVVNNDPDKSNNAFYTYDGTEFTKSDFDPQGILTTVDVRLNQAVESASDYFQSQVADTIATSIDNSTVAYTEAINTTKGIVVADAKLATKNALDTAVTELFENGGLPATPFTTKTLMEASGLDDGDYAYVTNDSVNNGLYVKTAGAWVKSDYDPLTQAIAYTDLQLSKSSGTFDTLALLTASTLADNAYALVANETDLTKNGYYKKLAGVWTRVTYDPVAIAATDATTKADTAKTEAIADAALDATAKANAAETNAKAYVDEKIKIILDDPEYILCISDTDSNLLFAITRQGEVIGDFKILLENISDLSTVLTRKDNFEGELYEIVDSQGNILAQVEPDGTWVLPAIRTTTLDSTEITGVDLNLGEVSEVGITKEKFIRIPEQNYLRLDLDFVALPTDTSPARRPQTGTCTISDSSKSVVYAKTNADMKVQGNASAGDIKKNYTIDFYNINGDELDLKFGDSIASDSYHLKGFHRDPSHMRDQGGYRCWKELIQKLDYPYSKINNIVYSASPSRPTNAEFTADAKYYPHGFPVEVYHNGEFYGLHTLRFKKSRNNYALDNSNTDHIFIDSGTKNALLREPFDVTDWEFKSPKMKGYDDLGPIPPAFTETVGASCTRLFEFTSTLSTSYPNHADYIVLPHWILHYLVCELIGHWDQNGNNYNIITWNSQQWSIIPYDLDWTLNWHTNEDAGNTKSGNLLSVDIWPTFRTVYTPEIKALWTKYRKNGDITVEKMAKHYRNAVSDIPREIYKADKDKWGSFRTFENVNYPDLEQVYRWFEARIAYLDSQYLIV